jgi:electron transport complex protein RnfD
MTRQFEVPPAPHLPPMRSVRAVMGLVLLALLPGVVVQTICFGAGIVLQIVLAIGFALAIEALMLRLRRQPMTRFLTDLSAPVTAVLFALCLPPLAPWWIALIGMIAAIVFAKHLYGGLGHNLFNPAMVGYAVVLVSFPYELSRWLAPLDTTSAGLGIIDTAYSIFAGQLPTAVHWDAIAQATPLDQTRQLSAQGYTLAEIRVDASATNQTAATSVAFAYLAGGIVLLWKRVIRWQIPVATLGTVVIVSLPFWLADPDLHPSPLHHLGSGALVLAAFFIATDPVSGCTTPRGRLVFGAGVALITLAIRRWGAYPDGVAFAILLMNCAAPWIDLHTRPRIVGAARRE